MKYILIPILILVGISMVTFSRLYYINVSHTPLVGFTAKPTILPTVAPEPSKTPLTTFKPLKATPGPSYTPFPVTPEKWDF